MGSEEDKSSNSKKIIIPPRNNASLPSQSTHHSALKSLTRRVVTVNVGEDIVAKIKELASTCESLTILGANGVLSSADISYCNECLNSRARHGWFQIASLTCSTKAGEEVTVNVSLSDYESKSKFSRVFISGVARVLITAKTPTQLIIATSDDENVRYSSTTLLRQLQYQYHQRPHQHLRNDQRPPPAAAAAQGLSEQKMLEYDRIVYPFLRDLFQEPEPEPEEQRERVEPAPATPPLPKDEHNLSSEHDQSSNGSNNIDSD
ncbi:hypothetical protein F8388_023696 [Cannabis sativa]|uniref:AT-hook motif nuclear-localized protein n=1 Tax=Cannabis sativa TaxID=3483 RepID=A0A7J6GC22_CANSA|nr:hypothetical protein F8388_023696 [Cannabis sativa]